MAREVGPDSAGNPYFIKSQDPGDVRTRVVMGAPVKIHRAAQSMGNVGKSNWQVNVEVLDPTTVNDWVPSEGDLRGIKDSKVSGFARYAELYGSLQEDSGFLGSLSEGEEKRIREAADVDQGLILRSRRLQRDPVTRVPENFAAIDRTPESDRFFGEDKVEPETVTVLDRMEKVDRGREGVDYKTSKAVPIKMLRR